MYRCSKRIEHVYGTVWYQQYLLRSRSRVVIYAFERTEHAGVIRRLRQIVHPAANGESDRVRRRRLVFKKIVVIIHEVVRKVVYSEGINLVQNLYERRRSLRGSFERRRQVLL